MSSPGLPDDLSMRERQALEILIRLGRGTARDVQRGLPEAPTYSAVRSILRILVGMKLIAKENVRGRDHFRPSVPVARARRGALQEVVKRFFANSPAEAACALLGGDNVRLSADEAGRLMKLIREARGK
ncbi:MAG: BlaI/MecI/CopY family transcriptional regulator [Chthoniobacterales bacterium]|nr:BlaI/MecI/CopY family transcriptional regulator [Chthoniobacterales bacterium]